MVGSSNPEGLPDRNLRYSSSTLNNAPSLGEATIAGDRQPSKSQVASPNEKCKSQSLPLAQQFPHSSREKTARESQANDLDNSPLHLSPNVRRWLTTTLAITLTGYSVREVLRRVEPETPPPDNTAERQSTPEVAVEIEPNIAAPEAWVHPLEVVVKPGWQQLSDRARALPKLQQHARDRIAAHIELNAFNLLQNAYTQAEQRNFATALTVLAQIPEGTSAYAQAQIKIVEYTEYQNIQANVWLRQAEALAKIEDFARAQVYLTQIPESVSAYSTARTKMTEYAQKQETQANSWLGQASMLASEGNFSSAIAYLNRVPLGTPAYTTAKEKIAEYSQQQQRFQALKPTQGDLNS
ncbi:hypothetical protein IQ235_02905 [Oscillatoriales cyanobacterium LEGE 11467]|uniref:Tetratricopeptide repeat protein n=1 Tax=Zarconia navalis LEGE 11467 TaxID=1828826 RepID=A0A928VT94_9CYAN|nr:hypothetical protein [Zarconia navalis]MBE9039741.1 hypothetical protein [Zarconia navalis LEGE 11467]